MFWAAHDATRPAWSVQYASFVFVHDDAQRKTAARSLAAQGPGIETRILDAGRFWRAEDYHQKYRLRHAPEVFRDLQRYYPDADALADSTAAARLNGFLAGYGGKERLGREIGEFGLSPEVRAAVLKSVRY